jgi:DNA-binding protein HU-beta
LPNKAQFIETLAERLDGDKKRASAALDAVIDTIYNSVAKGERVALTGFGVFEKRDRAARTARNPATGATVKVKKTSVPAFRAGSEFKAIVSGAKKLAKAPAKKAGAARNTAAATKSTGTAAATKATGGRTAAKRTTAAATKAPATKAAATKAPAKKAATKAPAKKTTATATKTTAKKTPAKRASKASS